MPLIENSMSLRGFAVLFGFILIADLVMQKFGLSQLYSFQDGMLFPILGQIMSLVTIFSFVYFMFGENRNLTKKFYRSCNIMFMIVAGGSLIIDFMLRFFAFDMFYCQNRMPADFEECKAGYAGDTYWAVFKLLVILRVLYYSCQMLQKYSDTVDEKDV